MQGRYGEMQQGRRRGDVGRDWGEIGWRKVRRSVLTLGSAKWSMSVLVRVRVRARARVRVRTLTLTLTLAQP